LETANPVEGIKAPNRISDDNNISFLILDNTVKVV